MLFTYAFAFAVGAAMLAHPGPQLAWPLMIFAAIAGAAGWAAAFAHDRGRLARGWMIAPLLIASAASLGFGRYAMKTHIPPFDPSAPANHILSYVEAFPNKTRNDRTRIIGTIVEEPLYRPVEGRPGTVKLVIKPIKVMADTDGAKPYEISDGNIAVTLSPSSSKFRFDEADWEKIFTEMALPEAYGYTIEVDVPLQPFRSADNPGGFDAEEFNADEHVFASGGIYFWDKNHAPIQILDRTAGNPVTELALQLKEGILSVYKQTMPFPESAFLAGSTLRLQHGFDGVRCMFEEPPPESSTGDQSDQPDFRKLLLDEFRWTGTSHVIAVSGLHVTIVTGALWAFFVMLRIPRKIYAPLVILGLSVFCLMNGASPATTRAVIMNSFTIITYVYFGASLRSSLLMSIGVAAFAILMNNPGILIHAAFMYSFGAVMAIALFAGPCEEVLKRIPGMSLVPVYAQQMIYIQSSLQIGMLLPLSAYYACQLTLSGVIANFFAIPMMAVFIPLGLIAGAIGMIPVVGIWIALVLNAANCVVIWLMLWIIHICTVILPFPMVQTFTPRMMAAYYGLMALVAGYKPLLRHLRILYYDLVMRIGGASRRLQSIAAFGGLFVYILACAVGLVWPRKPPGDLRVNILSVRYGDAIHIETPGGAQILVDAGGNDYRRGLNTADRTIAPYFLKDRIGALDAVVMSDPSPENIGGLAGVLKIFPVHRFYAALPIWKWNLDDPDKFRAEAGAALQNTAEDKVAQDLHNADFEDDVFHLSEAALALKRPWSFHRLLEVAIISPSSLISSWTGTSGFGTPECFEVASGTVLWSEDDPGGEFRIVALHPNPDYPLKPANNNGIVLRVEYGSTAFLLTSVLTADGIRELLRVPAELLKSDVIVVPAHGSSKSDVPYLYETVQPKTAVISFGSDRSLKPPPSRGHARTRETVRDSFLDHRQMFSKDVEAGADGTEEALAARGIQVIRTDEQGAVLCRSDGKSVSVQTMVGQAEAEDQATP